MARKARTSKSQTRRKPFRNPKPVILIVCEDSVSSPNYFSFLRKKWRLTSTVVIHGKQCGSAPRDVVNHAIAERKKRGLDNTDSTWCVMDVEAPKPHETLDKAVDKAKRKKIKVILTNPCFEYWLLLHFKKISSYFTNDKLLKRLKQSCPNYSKEEKTGNKIYNEIYKDTDEATKRASEILRENHCEDDPRKHNSSTHIHLLIKYLQEIRDRQ